MTVADWALIISICSAAVSLAGFVWSVWSKFIYPKPTVRVSFSFVTLLTPLPDDGLSLTRSENNALSLNAINMGPIAVTLRNTVAARFPRWRRRPVQLGLLNPLPSFPQYPGQFEASGPYAGGLPKKVEVGEEFSVYFVPDHEALAQDKLDRVGFTDTFGRFHWAARSDLIEARNHIREECDKVGKKY